MEVFKPGTKVSIHDDIQATINKVLITRSENCLYECVWWDGRTRKEGYLHPEEFQVVEGDKQTIGFK